MSIFAFGGKINQQRLAGSQQEMSWNGPYRFGGIPNGSFSNLGSFLTYRTSKEQRVPFSCHGLWGVLPQPSTRTPTFAQVASSEEVFQAVEWLPHDSTKAPQDPPC